MKPPKRDPHLSAEFASMTTAQLEQEAQHTLMRLTAIQQVLEQRYDEVILTKDQIP